MSLVMQDLAGTIWNLVEVIARDADGQEVQSPIGSSLGITMFSSNRMLGAVTDVRPPDKLRGTGRVYFSYTGRYSFDGTTLHTVADDASRPDMVKDHIRDMRFETPTRLVVTPKTSLLGKPSGLTFVWEKVEAAPRSTA